MDSFIDEEVQSVSEKAKYQIIRDHMIKTYYWTVGSFMFLVGFLLGTIAKVVN